MAMSLILSQQLLGLKENESFLKIFSLNFKKTDEILNSSREPGQKILCVMNPLIEEFLTLNSVSFQQL